MKDKVIIGDATLYLGDCLDILPTFDDSDADVVVTDPPYGVGLGTIKSSIGKNEGYTQFDDTYENILNITVPAIELCIQKFGRVVFTPGHRCAFSYPQPDEIGCFYVPAGGGIGRWGFITSHLILFYGADPHKRQRATSMQSLRMTRETNTHPCPKHIEWMDWLVNRASLQIDTILDPFMGSGTTGVACVKMSRKFIGIEIEPKYFDIACKRIEDAYRQGDMFIEPPRNTKKDQIKLDM